jgi:hypothetical protein
LITNRGHHIDDDVLLDGEWTRVQRDTKELSTRDDLSPETHNREREKKWDERTDGNSWETEEEELVDTLIKFQLQHACAELFEGKRQLTGINIDQMIPTIQARRVVTGMSGSSVFATAERTSG